MYLMLEIKYEFEWKGLSVYTVHGKLENKDGIKVRYMNTAIVSTLKPNEMYKIDDDEINKGRISLSVYNLIKNSLNK